MDDYETISDWVAKRVSDSITVYGKTANGDARRITNVDRIVVVAGEPQAVTKDDVPYWLARGPRP